MIINSQEKGHREVMSTEGAHFIPYWIKTTADNSRPVLKPSIAHLDIWVTCTYMSQLTSDRESVEE